jgi:hypothetical protein
MHLGHINREENFIEISDFLAEIERTDKIIQGNIFCYDFKEIFKKLKETVISMPKEGEKSEPRSGDIKTLQEILEKYCNPIEIVRNIKKRASDYLKAFQNLRELPIRKTITLPFILILKQLTNLEKFSFSELYPDFKLVLQDILPQDYAVFSHLSESSIRAHIDAIYQALTRLEQGQTLSQVRVSSSFLPSCNHFLDICCKRMLETLELTEKILDNLNANINPLKEILSEELYNIYINPIHCFLNTLAHHPSLIESNAVKLSIKHMMSCEIWD